VHLPASHAYTAEVAIPVEPVNTVTSFEGIAQPSPATVNVTDTPASAVPAAFFTVAVTSFADEVGPAVPARMSLCETNRLATPSVVSPELTVTVETAFAASKLTETVAVMLVPPADAEIVSVVAEVAVPASVYVNVGSGDTTDGVANLFVSHKDILAGTAGPTSSANDVTATVKNAAGTALAGVSVTFTVAGEGCAIPSNEVTVFTGSTGIATSAVYAWLAGKCTVTATAGGKTGTGVTSFRQETSTEIRTLSGSVAGTVVTAAPKDRFGNPVVNGTVYAVITAGNGYFGANGARTATLTTSAAAVD